MNNKINQIKSQENIPVSESNEKETIALENTLQPTIEKIKTLLIGETDDNGHDLFMQLNSPESKKLLVSLASELQGSIDNALKFESMTGKYINRIKSRLHESSNKDERRGAYYADLSGAGSSPEAIAIQDEITKKWMPLLNDPQLPNEHIEGFVKKILTEAKKWEENPNYNKRQEAEKIVGEMLKLASGLQLKKTRNMIDKTWTPLIKNEMASMTTIDAALKAIDNEIASWKENYTALSGTAEIVQELAERGADLEMKKNKISAIDEDKKKISKVREELRSIK